MRILLYIFFPVALMTNIVFADSQSNCDCFSIATGSCSTGDDKVTLCDSGVVQNLALNTSKKLTGNGSTQYTLTSAPDVQSTLVSPVVGAAIVQMHGPTIGDNIFDLSTSPIEVSSGLLSGEYNILGYPSDVSTTGSMHMSLSGPSPLTRIENYTPYTLAIQGHNFDGQDSTALDPGEYTLTLTSYAGKNASGEVGSVYQASFTIFSAELAMPQMPDDFVQNVDSGKTFVADFDPSGRDTILFSVSGADASLFTISPTGSLAFLASPSYSNPSDQNADNEYNISVTASNEYGADTTNLTVRVEESLFTVTAKIKPSRTECASPCTVVFSAEDTTATGMDEHDVFGRELAFYWDFDTDEDRTYGALYEQTYSYVEGDTAFEAGHVPLVTKTFVCETGICDYAVRMRAQDADGHYDDTETVISVRSEEVEWSAQNTVCVSNTLNTADDWTIFDKACPAGSTKQSSMPNALSFDGKLVLLRRGDVFNQNIATLPNQSNFKIGYFGDHVDSKPEVNGSIWLGTYGIAPSITSSEPTFVTSGATNSSFAQYGWPENIYIHGIKTGQVSTPMSFQHIGLHDLDMDRENYDTLGSITITRGRENCFYNSSISCENVPFAKGMYISSVNIVGSRDSETNKVAVNIAGIGCDMTNFFGITDTQIRKVGEHNIRLMGFYRLNIMRSKFRGQHYSGGKQKLTIRACLNGSTRSELQRGLWSILVDDLATNPSSYIDTDVNMAIETTWDMDVEGRTRQDALVKTGQYFHQSRYQVIHGNQIGDSSALIGTRTGSTKYQTNALSGDEPLFSDIILSENIFEQDHGATSGDFGGGAGYSGCFNNKYTGSFSINCLSPDPFAGDPNNRNRPPYLDFIIDVSAPRRD